VWYSAYCSRSASQNLAIRLAYKANPKALIIIHNIKNTPKPLKVSILWNLSFCILCVYCVFSWMSSLLWKIFLLPLAKEAVSSIVWASPSIVNCHTTFFFDLQHKKWIIQLVWLHILRNIRNRSYSAMGSSQLMVLFDSLSDIHDLIIDSYYSLSHFILMNTSKILTSSDYCFDVLCVFVFLSKLICFFIA